MSYNYGPFSDAMFGSVHNLLDNPELVASTWLNLASATWFYTFPQPPKPSMLHVLDGTWTPNEKDKQNGLESGMKHSYKGKPWQTVLFQGLERR